MEALVEREVVDYGAWYFVPSHLTKGLVCSILSFAFATYALREFKQVERAEVVAMVVGP